VFVAVAERFAAAPVAEQEPENDGVF